MAERRDMWNECYSGEHQRITSPEAFKYQFCSQCRQAACTNSAMGKSRWQARIETQEDRLLNHPMFADPNDPQFQEVRQLDFPDLLRKAMKLEISARKGDWEPVSADDATSFATELSRPSGFQPGPADDEVQVTRQEVIRGSDGKMYTVTLGTFQGQQVWDCTCPAFEFGKTDSDGMCKHIRQLLGLPDPGPDKKKPERERAVREPVLPPPPTREVATAVRPPVNRWQQAVERNQIPKAKNTTFPSDGMMLDGSPPPPPAPPVDPWAPKKPVGTVVPVGGKVVLGGGSKQGGS
jgi:hypothetical protein